MEKSPQIPTQLEKNIFPVRKIFFPNWIPKSVNLFSTRKSFQSAACGVVFTTKSAMRMIDKIWKIKKLKFRMIFWLTRKFQCLLVGC